MTQTTSKIKVQQLLPSEAIPGVLLLLAALLAMLVVNSPFRAAYESILESQISIGPHDLDLQMSISSWIKNALMAIFFFSVGLELKRELIEGQLSNLKAAVLPILAALGGMALPAAIFIAFTSSDGYSNGWAIPSATDIAFAMGVLSLLGKRVPDALKAFLLAVAVVDDLGAIVIVAIFYTSEIVTQYLALATGIAALMFVMNRLKLERIWLYLLMGITLWVVMYKSGISATISGVITAAFIPIKTANGSSPLHESEASFRPWVLFVIMPIFAFANAGVNLDGAAQYVTHSITLGAAFGLAIGKPIGIAGMAYLGAKLMKANIPGTSTQIVGVGCIAGIGFTMSLFVGALAFDDAALAAPVRLGVYVGSIFSAVLGLTILNQVLPKNKGAE
jgi:Na+:H+ antiporter, NhaA family